jgi:hypothetical protein
MAVLGGLALRRVALGALSAPEPAAPEVRAVTLKALMGAPPAKAEVVRAGTAPVVAEHRLERVVNLLGQRAGLTELAAAVLAVGGPLAVLAVVAAV